MTSRFQFNDAEGANSHLVTVGELRVGVQNLPPDDLDGSR